MVAKRSESALENTGVQYSVNEYLEGIPYYEAGIRCNTYEEYSKCCEVIDAEGIKKGVDPIILSRLHSQFERFFYKYEVMRERIGSDSRRAVVPIHNAAGGVIINFPRVGNEASLYITAPNYKIENDEIFWMEPETGSWHVICHTVIRPVLILYDIEKQKETVRLMYSWHGQNRFFFCQPSELGDVKYIRKLSDKGIGIEIKYAEELRDFLVRTLNDNRGTGIPEIRMTDKLGWIEVNNHIDFVPFSGRVVYSEEHVINLQALLTLLLAH